MPQTCRFTVEDWRQYGRLSSGRRPLQVFFLFQLHGDPGLHPAQVWIVGPEGEKGAAWVDQVEFGEAGDAFLEVPLTLDEPVPGRYQLQLLIEEEAIGCFPFEVER